MYDDDIYPSTTEPCYKQALRTIEHELAKVADADRYQAEASAARSILADALKNDVFARMLAAAFAEAWAKNTSRYPKDAKIEIIKAVRRVCSIGLKDAKDIVDAVFTQANV